ncbi:MAG: AAA family ATPase [Candidatus Altiarchaeota archaeon]|nr:AAA family ATPase [Candidatus Altiarchaeota archaeon]
MIALIGGPSGSGKTTISQKLSEKLKEVGYSVLVIEMDRFYKDFEAARKLTGAEEGYPNWDDPVTMDWNYFNEFLEKLYTDGSASLPIYNKNPGERIGHEVVERGDYVIIEGLWPLSDEVEFKNAKKYYVAVDGKLEAEERYERRLARDLKLGRTEKNIRAWWDKYTRPMEEKYVFPTSKNADIVVENGSIENLETSVNTIYNDITA